MLLSKDPIVYLPSVPSRFDPILRVRVPVYDTSEAKRYGDIQAIVPLNGHTESIALDAALFMVRATITKSFKENDYVVAIGDPILIAFTIHFALQRFDMVKVLRWDKITNGYQLIEAKAV